MTNEKEKRNTVAITTNDEYTEIIDAMDYFCLTEEDILTIYKTLCNAHTARHCSSCKKVDGHTNLCLLRKSMRIIESLLRQKNK